MGRFGLSCGVRSFSRSTDNPSPAPAPRSVPPAAAAPRDLPRHEPRELPRSPGRDFSREPLRDDRPRARAEERIRETPVCGLAAVQALFKSRADEIKRLFFDLPTSRRVGGMSGYLAGQKKIYRQVAPEELEKIAGTIHHGGIVAIIDQPPPRIPAADDLARWAKTGKPVVLLDRIGNAHNLGAIVRTLAFFGIENLVVAAGESAARPGESTYRVAEGGMEFVQVWIAADFARLCAELRAAGFGVVGTAVRGPELRALNRAEFLPKTVHKRADSAAQAAKMPIALVLGNEEAGLAPDVAKACDRLVHIPGSGQVESLNVSAATAVLVAALVVGAK